MKRQLTHFWNEEHSLTVLLILLLVDTLVIIRQPGPVMR